MRTLLYAHPTMTSSAYFPPSTHLFEMKGPDARDFLHRITTTNVRDLMPGGFLPGFILNPQGKIRAAFRVACATPDSFFFEVEGGKEDRWKTAFLAVMDEFTFAEKYTLTEKVGLAHVWIFGLPKATENHYEIRKIDGNDLIFLNGGRNAFGTSWTSLWGPSESLNHFLNLESTQRLDEIKFEELRISVLFPRIDRELLLESNPLEIGMRSGIADNKGCYPGQEVIEKIVSLGSPAKRLSLATGSGPAPEVGSPVRTSENAEVGIVTSACENSGGKFSVLALLRKTAATTGNKLFFKGSDTDTPIEMNIERVSEYE